MTASEGHARYCGRCGRALGPAGEACACVVGVGEPAGAERGAARGLVAGLVVYGALCVTLLAGHVTWLLAGEASETAVYSAVAAVYGVVVLGGVLARGREARRALARPARWRWVLLGAAGGVLSFLLAEAVVRALVGLGVPDGDDSAPLYGSDPIGWWWMAAGLLAWAPVVEEVAFRGVLVDAMRPALGLGGAALVSAVMFAVLHFQVLGMAHLLALAFCASALRAASGSLYPGMAMHAVHNGLVLASVAGSEA